MNSYKRKDTMSYKKPSLFFAFLLFSVLVTQSGCDSVSDVISDLRSSFSGSEEEQESVTEPALPSEGASRLTDILDSQDRIIEDIGFAKSMNDKESIGNQYKEFLRLEDEYQNTYDEVEAQLSIKELRDISLRHSELVQKMPRYSDLMRQ